MCINSESCSLQLLDIVNEVESKDSMLDVQGLSVGSPSAWSARTQWMFFAVASGACAAFNGVFAKL